MKRPKESYPPTEKKANSTYVTYNGMSNVASKILPNLFKNDYNSNQQERRHLFYNNYYRRFSKAEPSDSYSYSSSNSSSFRRAFNSSVLDNISICENCNNTTIVQKNIEFDALKEMLALITKELNILANKTKQDIEYDNRRLNWQFAAMIIDRLCMIIFSVATFTATFSFSLNFLFESYY